MKRTSATLVACAAAALAVGVWTSLHEDPPGSSDRAAGVNTATELFYQQTLDDAAGVPRKMSAYRGQVVVVNFWATWCVPCVKEIPTFSKVHAESGGRVAFVGLGIDSPDNIRAFNSRFGPSYPLVAAGATGTDLARSFGNDSGALPYTIVLDGTGRVVASHLGQVDEGMLKRWLTSFGPSDEPAKPS